MDEFSDEEIERLLLESEAEHTGVQVTSISEHCMHCHSACKLDQQMLENFHIAVCFPCRRERMQGEYKCISKTRASKEYLLNDAELGKLCSVQVRNPNLERRRNMMRLFLLAEVKKASYALWGEEDGLLQEKQRRRERLEANRGNKKQKFSLVTPTGAAVARSSNKSEESASVQRLLQAAKKPAAAAATAVSADALIMKRRHTHVFGDAVPTGVEEDEYCKTCVECGYRDVFESF